MDSFRYGGVHLNFRLNRARSELAQVSRVTALGTFTASIAHEINQPLSGIVTNAGTCLRMLAADPPDLDGARETARRTMRDRKRAAEVIARLRTRFSNKELTREPLDLNEATQEVLMLSSSDLQRHRIVLRSELADDLPTITGDRIQLQQVVINLLRNASDAMVTVDDRPRQLLIRTEREDDRVRLTVRVAGVGLDPQSMNKLFDAFYTRRPTAWGSGSSSAAPSSRNTTDVFGQSRTTAVLAPRFHFPFPPGHRARSRNTLRANTKVL